MKGARDRDGGGDGDIEAGGMGCRDEDARGGDDGGEDGVNIAY